MTHSPEPADEPQFDSECECCGHRGAVTLCQDQYDNTVVLCAPCIGLLTDAADG